MTTNSHRTVAARRWPWAPGFHVLSALVLVAAACGGDEDPEGSPDTGQVTSPATGDSATSGGGADTGVTTPIGDGGNVGPSPRQDAGGGSPGGRDAGPASASDSGSQTSSDGATTSTPDAGGGSSGTPEKSAGCGKPAPASEPPSIMVGSQVGAYILDVPPGYDNSKPYPLLFSWHGSGVKNSSFHGYINFKAAAGSEAIIVTPECLDGINGWPTDMAYFDQLLEHFQSRYCVDKSRIFTAGHSMGGSFTGRLGCLRGDVLRADAVLSAGSPRGTCTGDLAFMYVVGDADIVSNPQSVIDFFATKNKCDLKMRGTSDKNGCADYAGCAPGTPYRQCTYMGGHMSPSWVAAEVWKFFKSL